MLSDQLTITERKQAERILRQMGLDESERYESEVSDVIKQDMDANAERYEREQYVDKPAWVIDQERKRESTRRGAEVDTNQLTPLRDMVIVAMEVDRERTTKSGIILADLRPVKADPMVGTITKLNPNSEYVFNVDDRVVLDPRKVKHRFNHQGIVYFIIHKDWVLAVYE